MLAVHGQATVRAHVFLQILGQVKLVGHEDAPGGACAIVAPANTEANMKR